jgi:hypothetical protein
MKVPAVTKKPIFIFPTQLHHFSWRVHTYCNHINLQTVHICCQAIISFFRWFTHTVKWHHFQDGSCLLSSDHIILQMVYTYCQVMTSFLRFFTLTDKWSFLQIVHTYCQVMTSFLRWFTPIVKWSYHSSSSLQYINCKQSSISEISMPSATGCMANSLRQIDFQEVQIVVLS